MAKNYASLKEFEVQSANRIERRKFLQFAGLSAFAGLTVLGCKKQLFDPGTKPDPVDDTLVDFRMDTGVMNYLAALTQLDAAFFSKAYEALPADFNQIQNTYFFEIFLHTYTHREFYKRYLGAAGIKDLEIDLTSIDFTNKATVLGTAQTLKDLLVAGYNGAFELCRDSATLINISQIASVQARHSSWLRNQVTPGSSADLASMVSLGASVENGTDVSLKPAQIMAQLDRYFKTKLKFNNI